MRFSTITCTLAFAFTVSAAPQLGGILGGLTGGAGSSQGGSNSGNANSASSLPVVPSGTSIGSAINSCGSNTQLSCCNSANTAGNSVTTASGILSGLLGNALGGQEGLGLFDGCSKLSLSALIGVDDLLNSQCKQTAACCQGTSSSQNGLLNVGLPCVALGGLL